MTAFKLPTTLFTGTVDRTLDAKLRLTVPTRWRIDPEDGWSYLGWVRVVGDNPQCIGVYPRERVSKMMEDIFADAEDEMEAVTISQQLMSSAIELSADGQGRVVLPRGQLKRVGVTKEVKLVGEGLTFSLWSPDAYRRHFDTKAFPERVTAMRKAKRKRGLQTKLG